MHILHYIVLHLCVHITHGLDHRVGGLDPPPLPIGCNPWRLSLYDMWQIGLPLHLYIESMVRGVFIPSSPSWNPLLCLCIELLECLPPSWCLVLNSCGECERLVVAWMHESMVEDLQVVCKAALGVVRVEGVLRLHGWHSFLFSWGSSCVALHMGGIPFPPSRRLDYPIPYMHAWLELVWLGWEHPMMTPSPCVRLRGKLCATSGLSVRSWVRAIVHLFVAPTHHLVMFW